ncbi:hypothetical protein CU052_16935 [Vibrio harveyi]|uniref:hypothetical protein n=1 Tax=Vibrio harveyi TaxID=669 RepID=UPI000C7CA480|nr:hypothetical protein [Vibrio harveyi]AWB00877.1 hypothetical protein CU052_16935 [Vibrio harveyi]
MIESMKRFYNADFSKDYLTSLLPVFLMLVCIYIAQNMFFNLSVSSSYVESKHNVFEVSHNLPNAKKLSSEEKRMIYDNADLALNAFMNVSTNQSSNNGSK